MRLAGRHNMLPMSLEVMRICIPVSLRIYGATWGALLLLAFALGPRTTDDSTYPTEVLMLFPLCGVWMLWFLWMGRPILLQREAATFRLPGVTTAVVRALALTAIFTVVTPGLYFVLRGFDPVWALGLPVLAALCGLLTALSPKPFAWALLLTPFFGLTVWSLLTKQLGAADGYDVSWPAMMIASSAVAALLVVWRWSAIVRTPELEAIPRWRRAMFFDHVPLATALTQEKRATTREGTFAWSGVTRADDAGPHDIGGAIGACLGGALGKRRVRDRLKEAIVWMALLVILITDPLASAGLPYARDALLWGGVGGMLTVGWSLARALYRQRQQVSGPVAELALLPGLGTPEVAREALLGLVTRKLGHLLLWMLIGLCLAAWTRQVPWSHFAMLMMMWLGVAAGSLMVCVRALAGREVGSISALVSVVPLIVVATITMTIAYLRLNDAQVLASLFFAWMCLIPAYLAAYTSMRRRFRARLHPFLLQ